MPTTGSLAGSGTGLSTPAGLTQPTRICWATGRTTTQIRDESPSDNYWDFTRGKALTAAYGLTYQPSETLNFTTAFEMGQIKDGGAYDFDRKALSFGVIYQDEQLFASGRLEYCIEDGQSASVAVTSDTLLVSASAEYKIDKV